MPNHPRILIVECMQEISSFNPVPSHYENFHIERGEEMKAQDGLNTALGGALPALRAAGMEPVFTISARADTPTNALSRSWTSDGRRRSGTPMCSEVQRASGSPWLGHGTLA